MSIDYSKIIAIYKDGMELFRLYEGSNMLWEKPKYRRFYVYLQTEHELQSFISNILTSKADEAIIKSVSQFNNTIQADSLGGYLIEIYADSKFNQSISAEEYTSVSTLVLSRDHTENEISTHIGRATKIAYTNSINIGESFVIEVNNFNTIDIEDMEVLFGCSINDVQVNSVYYVPGIQAIDNFEDQVMVLNATSDIIDIVSKNTIQSTISPTLIQREGFVLYTFDNLQGYVQFSELTGIRTSIKSIYNIESNIAITLLVPSHLYDLDNLSLSDIDGDELQTLYLVEE